MRRWPLMFPVIAVAVWAFGAFGAYGLEAGIAETLSLGFIVAFIFAPMTRPTPATADEQNVPGNV